MNARKGYEGIAVAVPVTVPYERFSTKGAPWFLGRVLAELVKQTGIAKDDIDGLCVSSFSLSPDTAVGLTQHLGLSPRWLDHVPMGGASGVVAVRRAARAVPGSISAAPDLGKQSRHCARWREGRVLQSSQQENAIGNLCIGRTHADDFRVRVGGRQRAGHG